MKKKTRYNIALSERRGVKVRAGGEEDLPIFYLFMKKQLKEMELGYIAKNIFHLFSMLMKMMQ